MALSPKDAAQRNVKFADSTVAAAMEHLIDARLLGTYRQGEKFEFPIHDNEIEIAITVAEKYRAEGWRVAFGNGNLILLG